jgi:hypothetical protein
MDHGAVLAPVDQLLHEGLGLALARREAGAGEGVDLVAGPAAGEVVAVAVVVAALVALVIRTSSPV